MENAFNHFNIGFFFQLKVSGAKQIDVTNGGGASSVELKNILKELDVKSMDDFDGRDKSYWIQRVGEVGSFRFAKTVSH